MGSQSKEVRIEQSRILAKQLELRVQKLAQQGISKEKADSDTLVKSLKSKIRETNIRIATFDKNILRTQEMAQAKAQKLSEMATKKDKKPVPAPEPVEEVPKKKTRKNKEDLKQASN